MIKKQLLFLKKYSSQRGILISFFGVILLISIFSLSLSSKIKTNTPEKKQTQKQQVAGIAISITPQLQPKADQHLAETQTIIATTNNSDISTITVYPTITYTPTPTPKPQTNTTQQTSTNSQNTSITAQSTPTDTQTPTQQPLRITTTPSPTPTQALAVTLQITEPGGNKNVSIAYKDGLNPCNILNEAKDKGAIQSVNITYYSSFDSDYVQELDGHPDGWTYTVNGTSPDKGCSKINLKPNDIVIWKF